jgi:7-carboxy-7-deazaguanine synthase
LDAILQEVNNFSVHHVTVTGGEPLAQKPCFLLLQKLCDQGHEVSLETSGALDISAVDPRVIKVMDIKTPGSGEVTKNRLENMAYLLPQDQIKFVICGRADYDWAKQMIAQYNLTGKCEILFSPSYHQQPAKELADWIIEDRLPVRLQIQLHKYLWGDVPGH